MSGDLIGLAETTVETTGKIVDAGSRVGGFLSRIFGQGLEDYVALQWSDRIKTRRIEAAIYDTERLCDLVDKVDARLRDKGISNFRAISPKIGLSVIEHATIENDDSLQDLWAKLLVTGMDSGAAEVEQKYISVLADLTHADARVFEALCLRWFDPQRPPKPDKYGSMTYGPGVDALGKHDAISVITLNRLGLITPSYVDFISYAPNENRDYKDPDAFKGEDVRAVGNLEVVEITAFGEAFYKAVIKD